MDKKYEMEQVRLKYAYESAKGRKQYHPDLMEKRIVEAQKMPHFNSRKEAAEYASQFAKQHEDSVVKIWASIEKDEESYRISAPWVISEGAQHKVAEYIGLYYMGTASTLNPISLLEWH